MITELNIYRCPEGETLVAESELDGKCCYCRPDKAHCLVKGKKYTVDTVWSDGPCVEYECRRDIESGGSQIIKRVKECPKTEECLSHQKLVHNENECCATCVNVTSPTSFSQSIPGKNTAPHSTFSLTIALPVTTTLSISSQCHRTLSNQNITDVFPNCFSADDVHLYECHGSCISGQAVNPLTGAIRDNNCRCCQPSVTDQEVTINCGESVALSASLILLFVDDRSISGGSVRRMTIKVIDSCSCASCGS